MLIIVMNKYSTQMMILKGAILHQRINNSMDERKDIVDVFVLYYMWLIEKFNSMITYNILKWDHITKAD